MSSKIKPTDEQARIIEGAGKHTEMMVNATAGSGKSSVMCMIAAEHPVNSLLLTFNKALAVEASEKFPSWVSCRTTHSLAYGHFGVGLQDAERNLLYVALTRAKSFLGYNDTVQQMIGRVHGGVSDPDCFDLEKEIRELDRELEYTLDN